MIPNELKAQRVRKGYTQAYMAEKLEMSVISYKKKENGSVKFSEEEKFKLMEILEISIEEANVSLFDMKFPIGIVRGNDGNNC